MSVRGILGTCIMIHRPFEQLGSILQWNSSPVVLLEFNRFLMENDPNIPSDEDLDGIALALVRLQETYVLYPDKILGGLGKVMRMKRSARWLFFNQVQVFTYCTE